MNRSLTFKIFTILLALTLFVPIVFAPGFLMPFQSPKIFYFLFLIELAFPFYLALLFLYPSCRPDWKNPLTIFLILFLMSEMISAFFGRDPLNSFFGNANRMEGLIFWIHLLLFFLYLQALFKTEKKFQNTFVKLFLSLLTFTALIGIFQWLKWFPQTSNFGNRVASLFGNPIFFAGALIIPIFLLFGLIIYEKKRSVKYLYGLLFSICVLGFITSGTRGAYVGIIAGACAWLIVWFAKQKNTNLRNKFFLVITTIVLVIGSLFIFVRSNHDISSSSILYRLTHFADKNITSRLVYWNMSIKGWTESPWLGVGHQNFYVIADKYFQSSLYEISDNWPDKPHNQLLEILATGGMFAFGFYVLFHFFLLKKIISSKSSEYFFPKEALFGAIIAYVVQNLFVFDTIAPIIIFFFIVALVSVLDVKNSPPIFENRRIPSVVWLSFIVPIIVWLFYLLPATTEFKQILNAKQHITTNRSLALEDLSVIDQTHFVYDRGLLAKNYVKILNEELAEKGITTLAKQANTLALQTSQLTVKEHPKRAYDWYMYTLGLMMQAQNSQTTVSPEIIKIAEQTVNLAPARMEARVALANMYDVKGDTTKAMNTLSEALTLSPKNPLALWSLAELLKKQNQTEPAAEAALQSVQNGIVLKTSSTLDWIIDAYTKKGDTNTVVFLYEKSIEIEPNNIELLPKLASAYTANGQNDKAKNVTDRYKRQRSQSTSK